ncbi:conjugal transfer protein TrbC [Brevundimonas nasdae]|uniref:Conjugal transfer protein TrbC n=1 Tax=Brevundimonas nasdae TaxID=172043 RepID=A0A0B4DNV2_9CAUL|nr:conjugal transfer protein TrbC [Brevundimonas nasdae]
MPGIVEASSSGAGLPWENGLQTLQRSITGPVAMVISLLGIVVTGAMLIWGGEMNEFVRKMVMLIFVIALIVGASSILTTLFGVGAMIALPAGMVALS